MTQAPRAIVTDAEDRAALSACRALGAAGYDVTMIGTKRLAVGLWSRWCRERIRLPDPRLDSRAYVERVAEELARKRHDVLLLGSEASLIPISEHRELLDSHVRVGLPPHETVLRSMDKAALADEAEAVGLAPPPTRVCESLEDAKEAAAELGYPVIVKPERSYATRHGQLEHAKVRIAVDEPALREAVEASGTPLILQHYVASPRVVYCSAVRADGRLLGFTFVDMRRTWPPDAGSASMAVTLDPPDGLEAKVDDLMSRIGWEGIFQLQFLDLGGGRFAVIDLNPRLFASIALLTRAGANLPAAWCDHLLGRNSSRLIRPRAGVYYRCEDTELRYAARQALSKNFSAALSVLRPHRPVIYPYFELRDPVPFIARLVELIWRTKAPRPHQ